MYPYCITTYHICVMTFWDRTYKIPTIHIILNTIITIKSRHYNLHDLLLFSWDHEKVGFFRLSAPTCTGLVWAWYWLGMRSVRAQYPQYRLGTGSVLASTGLVLVLEKSNNIRIAADHAKSYCSLWTQGMYVLIILVHVLDWLLDGYVASHVCYPKENSIEVKVISFR